MHGNAHTCTALPGPLFERCVGLTAGFPFRFAKCVGLDVYFGGLFTLCRRGLGRFGLPPLGGHLGGRAPSPSNPSVCAWADCWCTPRSTIMAPFRGKKYIRNPSGAALQNSSRNKGKGKAAAAPAAPEASTPPPSPSRAMTCGPMPGDTVCFGKRARTPGQTALRSPNPESPSYVTVTSGATPIAEISSIRR